PPAPVAGADRHGGAGRVRRGLAAHGEGEGAFRGPAARRPGHGHRARPVRRRMAGRPRGPRLGVDTRRWAGVPFYLRAGKRLPRRMTEIALMFQRAPHLPFAATDTRELGQNALVIRIQPDEGITVRFGSKVPGTAMEVRDVNMDFAYGESFTESSPEAYERLLLDGLIGDPPLFPRQQEVELGWRILDPVENFWAEHTKPEQYAAGSAGPASADAMMARDGRAWRRL